MWPSKCQINEVSVATVGDFNRTSFTLSGSTVFKVFSCAEKFTAPQKRKIDAFKAHCESKNHGFTIIRQWLFYLEGIVCDSGFPHRLLCFGLSSPFFMVYFNTLSTIHFLFSQEQ